ncbi:MAG: hypothetical protein P1V51_10520 [Deltaproteobacteria bacterium]|nr:hypothetical protein [Deltaproteobacteria bacterium]
MAETFGLLLVREGLIDREALYEALRLQKEEGGLLGTCLLTMGHLKRGQLLQALARHLSIPPAPPSRVIRPDPDLQYRFDAAPLLRLRAVPYARGARGEIQLAFADPRSLPALEELRTDARGEEILLRVATEPDIEAGLAALGIDRGAQAGLPPGDEAASPQPEPPAEDAAPGVAPEPAERFVVQSEVDFAQATGFDQAKTAVFRLDEVAAAAREMKAEKAAAAPAAGPPPDARFTEIVDEEEPAGSVEVLPDPPRRAPPPAMELPAASPMELPAASPMALEASEAWAAASAADPVFRDEAEVAFSQATGFDREATAVFRLDSLASSARPEQQSAEEGLPAPPDAPRIAEAAEKLFEATNEGGVARQLVKFYSKYFPRVIVLTRHGDVLRGLLSRGVEISGPQVAQLRFPLGPFARLFEEDGGYYGPPPGGQELEPLYQALGETAVHALVVPIPTAVEPPWLLFADHGSSLERYDDVHELEMMAKEAAVALDLLRERSQKREAVLPPPDSTST